MRAGGQQAKGAEFERQICTQLSRWVSAGRSDSCFWRSAMSGGRATVRHKVGKSVDGHGGDITATNSAPASAFLSVFAVECKHVKTLNLHAALLEGKGELAAYWMQAATDATRAGKQPFLIAKQNRCQTLALLRESVARTYFGMASQIERGRLFRLEGYRVSLYYFDELLEAFPFDKSRFS